VFEKINITKILMQVQSLRKPVKFKYHYYLIVEFLVPCLYISLL